MRKRDKIYKLGLGQLEKIIDPIFNKKLNNREHIIRAFIQNQSTTDIDLLLELFLMDGEFVILEKGAYVKVCPKNYWEGDEYDSDKLADVGLLSPEGYLYAQIKDSHDYDESFNQYCGTFKLNLFIIDKKGKLKEWEQDMNRESLSPVDRLDIPYFKAKYKIEDNEPDLRDAID